MELTNKTAYVTGAGKGIGRAIAEKLAQDGANVGLIARTQTDLEKVARHIEETYQSSVSFVVADIGQRTDVDIAVEKLKSDLGPADILINNAGIGKFGNLVDMPVEDWEQMIQVNLLGTYYVTRAILPDMIAQNYGNIINVSSTAGLRGSATTSAYSASKFGMMGMTESLMQEVRRNNIRVTSLSPSTVNTELAERAGLSIGDKDHMMQPEDLAQVVSDMLKLPQRVFLKQASLWMTNPQ